MSELISNYWHVGIVGVLLIAISIGFFTKFEIPARRLGKALRASTSAVATIRDRTQGHIVELGEIASEAMSEPRLGHLWSEYAETLHPQREDDEDRSRFFPYTKCSDILMNGVYWDEHVPRLFETTDIDDTLSIQTIAILPTMSMALYPSTLATKPLATRYMAWTKLLLKKPGPSKRIVFM